MQPHEIDALFRNNIPLVTAVALECPGSVYRFANAGANLETRDSSSMSTPLQFAVGRADLLAVEALIEAGADLDARDRRGHTPFRKIISKIVDYSFSRNARIQAFVHYIGL
jgi:hypothetical protein